MLSRSIVTGRGEVDLSDGGAGNTEDLSSYVLSLNGEKINGEELSYQLAFRHLAQGDADSGATFDDENGVVGYINYVRPVTENVTLDGLVEYATIDNFGGFRDLDVDYITTSLITRYQQWNVTLGYTGRDIDDGLAATSTDDHLFQATAGYDFGNGITLDAGYRGTEEADISADQLGALLRYVVEF